MGINGVTFKKKKKTESTNGPAIRYLKSNRITFL